MRLSQLCVSFVTVAAVVAGARAASAEPFVYRPLTLPRSEWAFDFGLGVGHRPGVTGPGVNVELAGGLTSDVQLGFRTGFRLDDEGRVVHGDSYGRTFETETYDTGGETLANPEISLRWALARSTAEVALDTRVYLPFATGTRVGVLVGLPIALHLGGAARIDTGIYVPIIFTDPVQTTVSIPLHLWIQASNHVFLGPLTGVRFHDNGGETVQFGFGLGTALSHNADFKTWLFFPHINNDHGGNTYGFGFGLQFRF